MGYYGSNAHSRRMVGLGHGYALALGYAAVATADGETAGIAFNDNAQPYFRTIHDFFAYMSTRENMAITGGNGLYGGVLSISQLYLSGGIVLTNEWEILLHSLHSFRAAAGLGEDLREDFLEIYDAHRPHNPILPDYIPLGNDSVDGVITFAEEAISNGVDESYLFERYLPDWAMYHFLNVLRASTNLPLRLTSLDGRGYITVSNDDDRVISEHLISNLIKRNLSQYIGFLNQRLPIYHHSVYSQHNFFGFFGENHEAMEAVYGVPTVTVLTHAILDGYIHHSSVGVLADMLSPFPGF